MANKVQELLGVSIDKIREMVDVSTVIGDPIAVNDDTVLIPVSKATYGFAGGGSDLPTKSDKDLFGGAGGAGINITPIAMIACTGENVRVLPLVSSPDVFSQMASMIPETIDKVTNVISSLRKK